MIILCADHGGFELKNKIKQYLISKNVEVFDAGALEYDPEDDYPDYAIKASQKVLENNENKGIFICKSSIGVCMVANRFKGIRAASAQTVSDAQMARRHEDANVLCLGANITPYENAIEIAEKFLQTAFEGGRHLRRISKF